MSEANRREDSEKRELRKLAYEDSDRTFAEVDPDRLTPKLPLDPPKLQWKDTVGDPQPKQPIVDVPGPGWKHPVGEDPKHIFDPPKHPITDLPKHLVDPPKHLVDPPKHLVDPPKPPFDPKQPWRDPEPKSIVEDKGGLDPPKHLLDPPKQPWRDPEPKSIIEDKGGLDPKGTFDPPKHLLDPPKQPWQDPEPKPLIGDPGDPKHPKVDIDPDPKGILDPKNIYDPPKLAYDPGPIFDPGRVFDPGLAARRPFVLGMPHHAPSAGAMAGADPRTATMRPPTSHGTDVSPVEGGAADSAAAVEAMLAQVESSMRVLKADLERLDDYYRELRERYDELEAAEGGTDDADTTEDDGE